VKRIELLSWVLETPIMPLYYTGTEFFNRMHLLLSDMLPLHQLITESRNRTSFF
jgi:hypothetical protein